MRKCCPVCPRKGTSGLRVYEHALLEEALRDPARNKNSAPGNLDHHCAEHLAGASDACHGAHPSGEECAMPARPHAKRRLLHADVPASADRPEGPGARADTHTAATTALKYTVCPRRRTWLDDLSVHAPIASPPAPAADT